MITTAIALCLLSSLPSAYLAEQDDHRDFQYNSLVDNRGLYNFAYDTGNDPHNAHSMHMEYRDQYGVVRGRYGYTDPRGQLRVVEYEAGPGGFKARGDVGPDLFPHANTPEKPTPLRMAGWNPNTDPIDQRVENEGVVVVGGYPLMADPQPVYYPVAEKTSTKESESYEVEGGSKGVVSHVAIPADAVVVSTSAVTAKGVKISEPLKTNQPLTVHNIDVDPNDIRMATGQQKREVTTSRRLLADDLPAEHRVVETSIKTKSLPVRIHDHSHETTGKLVVSHDQDHDHTAQIKSNAEVVHVQPHSRTVDGKPYYHHHHTDEIRRYPVRQTHDHAAEYKKYPVRQTHDHAAEYKKYPLRQTHDHAAEYKKLPLRQTHDHDAEFKKYPLRQTHDHAAEYKKYPHDHAAEVRSFKDARTHDHSHDHGSAPLRVYYNDEHDTKPHEHVRTSAKAYENEHYYGHSDDHVYADRRSYYTYPLKPRLLRSRPGTPYRPASYYWE